MQELEYLFFLSRKVRIFFPEFNIRLYDKNIFHQIFFVIICIIYYKQSMFFHISYIEEYFWCYQGRI
jgi:hypothetical protein